MSKYISSVTILMSCFIQQTCIATAFDDHNENDFTMIEKPFEKSPTRLLNAYINPDHLSDKCQNCKKIEQEKKKIFEFVRHENERIQTEAKIIQDQLQNKNLEIETLKNQLDISQEEIKSMQQHSSMYFQSTSFIVSQETAAFQQQLAEKNQELDAKEQERAHLNNVCIALNNEINKVTEDYQQGQLQWKKELLIERQNHETSFKQLKDQKDQDIEKIQSSLNQTLLNSEKMKKDLNLAHSESDQLRQQVVKAQNDFNTVQKDLNAERMKLQEITAQHQQMAKNFTASEKQYQINLKSKDQKIAELENRLNLFKNQDLYEISLRYQGHPHVNYKHLPERKYYMHPDIEYIITHFYSDGLLTTKKIS